MPKFRSGFIFTKTLFIDEKESSVPKYTNPFSIKTTVDRCGKWPSMCGKLCGKLNVGKKSVENIQHKKYVFPINNLHIIFIVTVNSWCSFVVLDRKKYIG